MRRLSLSAFLLLLAGNVQAGELATKLRESAECGLTFANARYCKYRLPGLTIELAGIGQDNVGWHFTEVQRDKWLDVGTALGHGCAFVSVLHELRGLPEHVFISAYTGGVYEPVGREVPTECFAPAR